MGITLQQRALLSLCTRILAEGLSSERLTALGQSQMGYLWLEPHSAEI